MLVRAALLTLLALGLARPTMTSLSSLLGGGNASAVAIVLDNSASMGMVDQNRLRFEVALARPSRSSARSATEIRWGSS